jgi:AraC-like DNA-binding protein
MHRLTLTTEGMPERNRFYIWRDAIEKTILGIGGYRNNDEAPFHGSVAAAAGPSFYRFRYRSSSHTAYRNARWIARYGWDDYIWVYREVRGNGAAFEYDGKEFVTTSEDLIVANPTSPFTAMPHGGFDFDLWFLPRSLFDPHVPGSLRLRSLHLRDRVGIHRVLLGYLDAVGQQLGDLGDNDVELISDNLCRLIAVACGAAAGEQQEALGAARLLEIKRYIGLHLADPDLNPAKAAAALKMSLRQLHRLFEPTGVSFAECVLRRRLEECRAALISAGPRERAVTDIAFAWGFNSLATFYRAFRAAFGMTPGELRAKVARPSE